MTNIEIFNLTQHPINIVDENNVTILAIEPKRNPEMEIKISRIGTLGGVPITKVKSIKIRDLPPFKVGIFYIVNLNIVHVARAEGRTISDLLLVCQCAYGEDGGFIGYRILTFLE